MTILSKPAATPWDAKRWPSFSLGEIACPCCGVLCVHKGALDTLQKLRDLMAAPLHINSANRCAVHNKKVGGVPHSLHLSGAAFDIAVSPHDRRKLYWSAQIAGFNGFGFMSHALHVDRRAERAMWNYGPSSIAAWAGVIPAGTTEKD